MNSELLQDMITERDVFVREGDHYRQCRTIVPTPVGEDRLDNDELQDVLLFRDGSSVPVNRLDPEVLFVCEGSELVPLTSMLV